MTALYRKLFKPEVQYTIVLRNEQGREIWAASNINKLAALEMQRRGFEIKVMV